LYRATAQAVLRRGLNLNDTSAAVEAARALALDDLDEASLRGGDMGEAASVVAAMPQVREMLIDLQRRFAQRPGGAVLDGRDIGTVICPDADVKIFVTASSEARARRRAAELTARGERVDFPSVLDEIKKRDERDSHRAAAPLKVAGDAIELDTTELDVEAAFAAARHIVEAAQPHLMRSS
jgi:cytidylate kinase